MKRFSIRNKYMFLVDILLCILSYLLALIISFQINDISKYVHLGIEYAGLSAVVYLFILYVFGTYSTAWSYASIREYTNLLVACIVAFAVTSSFVHLISPKVFYFKFHMLESAITSMAICCSRVSLRFARKLYLATNSKSGVRTLVIGAGRLAVEFLRENLESEKIKRTVVGLIDDDPSKIGYNLYGAPVLGSRDDIVRICEKKKVEEIVFAMYNIPNSEKTKILNICTETNCKIKIMISHAAMLDGTIRPDKVRKLEIEDLLERDPISLENELISNDIEGKTILVTGGGGSIGSELCRQIIKYNPKKLIILDIYENTTYELQRELNDRHPEQDIEVLIASIRDKQRLNLIFEKFSPDIVFHAAAHKHVPLMEFSPAEAIKNNVFGTYNVASCADEYKVKKFVMISTDKAVNPTNVMGATKRMCEMIIQTFAKTSKTDFVATRFGNVLGSAGSVIPHFKKRIEEGGPITVTHPEITRFFMTIPEAAQLVLQAAAYATGGEIFVFDMGEPVKIYDLAKKMIILSGYNPGVDIKIEFSGLRPGEKLYEELLMNEEGLSKTRHDKIFVGQPIDITTEELNEKLDILRGVVESDNDEEIKNALKKVVPTYHSLDEENVRREAAK